MVGINNYIRIGKRMKQVRIKTGISQKEMDYKTWNILLFLLKL